VPPAPARPPAAAEPIAKKVEPPSLRAAEAKPAAVWPPLPVDSKTERLLKALDAPSKADRLVAMRELGNKGTQGRIAIPVLMERMCHTDREHADQAGQAALALAQIGAPAVPELIKALGSPSPSVRARALWALGIIGPEAGDAVPAICPYLDDESAVMRFLALAALAEMPREARSTVPQVARRLRDDDPYVRCQAALALRRIGPDTLVHLLPVTHDTEPATRFTAVQSLALYQEAPEAVQALVDAVSDTEPKVRAAAGANLIQLGPLAKNALPRLLALLKEDNLDIQTLAFAAVLAIGDPGDAVLLRTLDELNATFGWSAGPALKSAEVKENIQRLTQALEDASATRRLGAVLALGKLGPQAKSAVPWLNRRLNDSNRAVLAATVLVLPLIDSAQKTEGKTCEMLIAESWTSLRSTKKPDVDELVQLYLLTSTLSCPRGLAVPADKKLQETVQSAQAWAAKTVDNLPASPSALPALVRGINTAAEFHLAFTEPFSRLSFKLRTLAKDSSDLALLGYALVHLGDGVGPQSPMLLPIQQCATDVLLQSAFLENLIARKKQVLEAATAVQWQKQMRQLEQAMQVEAQVMQRLQLAAMTGSIGPQPTSSSGTPHLINVIMRQGVNRDAGFDSSTPSQVPSFAWYFGSDSTTTKVGNSTPFGTGPQVQGSVTTNPGACSGTIVVVVPNQYYSPFT
jgi:HEAT repeat protein